MVFHFLENVFPVYLLNIIPRTLIVSCCSLIGTSGVCFWIFNVSLVLIGRIIVFSRLSTFAADSWFFRNRLVSSAY